MTNHSKFVLESFQQFISEHYDLSEAEKKATAMMDMVTSKDLIEEMIDRNIDLGASALERQAKETPGTKSGEIKQYASEALKNKEFWKASACNMLLRSSDKGMTKNLKLFQALDLDFEALKKMDTKKRLSQMLDALKKASDKNLKDAVVDDLKQSPDLLSPQLRHSVLWQIVPEGDKTKVYEDFEKLARSKGYDDPEAIRNLINKHYEKQKKDERLHLNNPAIIVGLTKDQLESDAPPLKYVEQKAQMLPVDQQHETFKPNKWGANGSADFVESRFETIKNNVGKILEERKLGRVSKIKGITIQTSCDRRRNTGDAENMSWGQLALARALTMASLVIEMAKKVELQPEEIDVIQQMIQLDFLGTNGDGSSGPNSDVNPGYYVKSGNISKWVTVKDPSEVVIIPASEENGEPTKTSGEGADTKTETPISAKDSEKFNPYRYNNIIFDVEVLDPASTPGGEIPASQVIKDVKYPIELRLPPRFKAKSATIKIPSFSAGKVSGAPGKRPSTQCPNLRGGKMSLRLGFQWKQVTITEWQSDITKK